VELTTWTDGENISTEAIHTDGQARQSTREGCVGEEEAGFSEDGRRVYLRSEYVCEGGMRRSAGGLLAFANPMEWLDIKVIQVMGERVPMVLRYRVARASRVEAVGMEEVVAPQAMAVKAARIGASARLTADDLIEATGKVDGKALEALIAERGDPFHPDAQMLIRMADAGVDEGVIDLAVAVSYPDKFVVSAGVPEEVPTQVSAAGVPSAHYGFGAHWSFWNPFYYDPFYYSPFGYAYSPYYYNYGWYSGYYRPVYVVVRPENPVEVGRGRVVKGGGYTRGSSGGGSGYASPGTRRAPSTRSSGSSRGGSGAMTTSGASRGSTSSSTGRTAKRRGGGGI
jgi:hypothetical protein